MKGVIFVGRGGSVDGLCHQYGTGCGHGLRTGPAQQETTSLVQRLGTLRRGSGC